MASSEIRNFIKLIIKPFIVSLAGLITVNVLWAVDLSLRPYLLKIIINKVSISSGENIMTELAVPAFFYLFTGLLMSLIFRLYQYINLKLHPKLKSFIMSELTDRMMLQSYSFYQTNSPGSINNKIKDVMNGMPELIRMAAHDFLAYSLAIFIAIITVWKVDPLIALSLLLWSLVYSLASILSSKKGRDLSDEAAEVTSNLMGHINDLFNNIASIRFFVKRKYENMLLDNRSNEYIFTQNKRDFFFLKLTSFQSLSFVIYQATSMVLLMYGFKNHRITSGDFALILSINISMVDCLWMLSTDIIKFTETIGNVTQGLRTILTPIEIKDHDQSITAQVTRGEIKFINVSFNYQESQPVFEDLNIHIKPGEKVGLVGYSGGGKSSFVNLLLRMYDLKSGQILIDGQDIATMTQDSLRASIGIIPQDLSLFNRSLYDNIAYGKDHMEESEVYQAAKLAHIDDFIEKLPESYQTFVGERGGKLSGGQKQRVIIARAILKNAPILILDEATSHLDSVTESYIQHSLKNMMKDKTSLIIAHKLSLLPSLDRILVFDKGKIVEQGKHSELIKTGTIYRLLWENHQGEYLGDKDQESETPT